MLNLLLHLISFGKHLGDFERVEHGLYSSSGACVYFCLRSTTLRTSALKISRARCTKGLASAASPMLPTCGGAIGAAESAVPSPGTTSRRVGAPSLCSSWRIIFSAAVLTVRASPGRDRWSPRPCLTE